MAGWCDERLMNAQQPMPSVGDPAALVQPAEGPLSQPAYHPQAAAKFVVLTGQVPADPQFAVYPAPCLCAVRAAGDCLVRILATPVNHSSYVRRGIEDPDELWTVVLVGLGRHRCQRHGLFRRRQQRPQYPTCGVPWGLVRPIRRQTTIGQKRCPPPRHGSGCSRPPGSLRGAGPNRAAAPTGTSRHLVSQPSTNVAGRSSQRVPVLKTNMMPRRTLRWFSVLRPS